jgi:hypothetical protein
VRVVKVDSCDLSQYMCVPASDTACRGAREGRAPEF